MDDTVVFQAGQQQPSSSVPPIPPQNPAQPFGAIPPVQNQTQQIQQPSVQAPSQPIATEANKGPAGNSPSDADAPRITLNDLYGPSQSQDQPITPSDQPFVQQQTTPQVMEEPVLPSRQAVAQSLSAESLPIPQTTPASIQEQMQPEVAAQVTQSSPKVSSQIPSKEYGEIESSGGFGIPPFLRFLVGGIVLAILIFIVWLGASLFLKNQPASGKVQLTYWGLWEDSQVMQPIISDFERLHPDITVTYTKQDPKQYVTRLLARSKDGTGPDIFRFHNSWVLPLQSLLTPLPSTVVDAKTLSSQYPPVVSQDLVKNGALYGLPLSMDNLVLFVNKDIFTHAGATVPTSWDNFITVAKALTVKDPAGHIKTAGVSLGTYDNISHAPDILSLLLLQNGADLGKLNGSQNATDALTFYTSFASGQASVWDGTLDNSLLAFSKGELAMYFGYSYDIFAMKAINPTLTIEVHPVPHLPDRNTTIASYFAEGIAGSSKHQKEAALFLSYLAQKDTQQKLYTEEAKTRSFGELYARTDLAQSLSGNQLLAPFVAQYPDMQSSFFIGETDFDEYNGVLNQYLGNAINGTLKNTSPESALSTLAQGVAQVTSQYAPKTQ